MVLETRDWGKYAKNREISENTCKMTNIFDVLRFLTKLFKFGTKMEFGVFSTQLCPRNLEFFFPSICSCWSLREVRKGHRVLDKYDIIKKDSLAESYTRIGFAASH